MLLNAAWVRECSAAPRSVTSLLTQQPGDGDMAPRPPRLGILQLGTPGHCNVLWQHTGDWQCSISFSLSVLVRGWRGACRVTCGRHLSRLVTPANGVQVESRELESTCQASALLVCSTLLFVAYFLLQNKTSHLFCYLSNLRVYLQYCCFLRETVETSGQDLKFEHSTFEISFIRHNFADKQNNVSNCFIFWKSWRYFL